MFWPNPLSQHHLFQGKLTSILTSLRFIGNVWPVANRPMDNFVPLLSFKLTSSTVWFVFTRDNDLPSATIRSRKVALWQLGQVKINFARVQCCQLSDFVARSRRPSLGCPVNNLLFKVARNNSGDLRCIVNGTDLGTIQFVFEWFCIKFCISLMFSLL